VLQGDDSVGGTTGRSKKRLCRAVLILGLILIPTVALISVFAKLL
jgi:hypothetical protein